MHDTLKSSGSTLMSNTVLLLGGLAMAGMASATWRAVDVAIGHHAAVLAAQHHHNQELVNSIETLAEKASVLTSADLCPVRFRLRCKDGHLVPVLRPVADLEDKSEGEFRLLNSTRATVAGTIDFGLNPPGQYRLSIEMDDGMHLQHEFDVLPGVPVDRLITCPWKSTHQSRIQLEIDWPKQLTAQQLLAVCCIEPASYTHDCWTWHPPTRWSPAHALSCNSGRELSASDLSLLKQSIPIPDDVAFGLQPAARLTVPFRYCRMKQITFLGHEGERQELVALGTAVFDGKPDLAESRSGDSIVWYSKAPTPMFERNYLEHPERWTVQLPGEIVDKLLRRIHDVTAAGEPSRGIQRQIGSTGTD